MNVKNIVLGIGIFIVFLLMLNYGIEAFYKSPKYDDFCKPSADRYLAKPYAYPESANCTFSRALQEQVDKCTSDGGFAVYGYDDNGCYTSLKECNFCQKEYDRERIAHDKVVFVIAIIVGIITLFIGFLVLSTEPVGSALMASGVGAIFYGSVRNWENLSNVWRFLLLLLALVLLVWIALRLNRQRKDKSRKKR